jgi:asparagine synthase (glutamine-hydrolysing)
MDYRLAEWIFTVPDNLKLGDGCTKVILRNYLKRVGLTSIARRRDKQGYQTPVVRWLTANGGALAKEILLSQDSRILEYCNGAAIAKLINHYVNGKAVQGDNLYKLVSTEFWLRTCILRSNTNPSVKNAQ